MSSEDKKAYNPDEIKTVVDVLDQNALMRVIVDELPSYTGSKVLKLSKLGINQLAPLQCLDALNRIDLSYNKLKSVRALDSLKALTYINLSYNQLSGKGIRGILLLKNVVFLNLGYNRIAVLPDVSFVEMRSLKCLLLNNNKLEGIMFIRELPELNTLILSNNQIASIPTNAFELCTKLRKISLGHNQLTEFPNVFSIPYLKELNLNSNRISSIPDAITALKHLTLLDLGNNLIESIESLTILRSVESLTKLNVAQNDFYRCDSTDKEALEKVNKRIQELLPQLLTLNNRILSLGVEKREQRKKHYEEKQSEKKDKRIQKERQGEKKENQGEKKEKRIQKEKPGKKEKVQKTHGKVATKAPTSTSIKEQTRDDGSVDTQKQSLPPTDAIPTETASITEESPNPTQNQSGVVSVETAYSIRKNETKPEELEAFFKGTNETDEAVGGWDD